MGQLGYVNHTPRVYFKDSLNINTYITLSDMLFNYLINVMRFTVGSKCSIFNEADGEFTAEIVEYNPKKRFISALIHEKVMEPYQEQPLTLLFAPIKHPSYTFIAQKATELGVTNIVPIITERTVVKNCNIQKLEAAVIEASEQCGRFSIPKIFTEHKLKAALDNKENIFSGTLIFCDESLSEQKMSIGPVITTLETLDNAIIIGPEGGFSPKEIELIKSYDTSVPVTLGRRILRAETAMITAISIYQSIKEADEPFTRN